MIVVTLTLIFAWGLPHLYFDDGYEATFRTTDKRFADYQLFVREFGTEENSVFIVLESPDFVTREALSTVRAVHVALQAIEGIESVQSLYSVRRPQRVGRYFLPLLPGDDAPDIRWQRTFADVPTHTMIAGHLLSVDHKTSLMAVKLKGTNLSVDLVRARLDAMRQSLNETLCDSSVTGELTGIPVLRVEIVSAVTFDQVLFGGLGTLLATLLAWFIFRKLRTVAIVVAAPLCGVIWTMGLMGLVGEPINVLNCVLSPLLLVIGLSDAVHLMFVIRREVASGRDVQSSTVHAIQEVGLACFLTSLTTAIGFGSLATSGDLIIRNFGIAAAAGAILTYLSVMTVIPLLSRLLLPSTSVATPSLSHRSPLVYGRCLEWVIQRPLGVATTGTLVAVVLLCGALQLRPDFRYTENLPQQHSALQTLRRMDKQFAGSTDVSVVARWPSDRSLGSTGVRRLIEELHDVLRTAPHMSEPISVETLVASLPGQTRSDRLRELRFVPKTVTKSLLGSERQSAVVRARLPDIGSYKLRTVMEGLESRLEMLRTSYPWASLGLEGLSVISTYRSSQMISDLARSLVWASAAIFIVISIAFRSITWGLASILSNALPILCVAATIHWMGLPLRYGTAIVFTICLGIAVDDTIHVLAKLRRVRLTQSTNDDFVLDVTTSMISVWPALLATTLLLVCGFGVVVFGSFPPMRTFGGLACLGLTVALLSDAFLLPTTLVTLHRFGRIARSRIIPVAFQNRRLAAWSSDTESDTPAVRSQASNACRINRIPLFVVSWMMLTSIMATVGLRRGFDVGLPIGMRISHAQDHLVLWEVSLLAMSLTVIALGIGFYWWSGQIPQDLGQPSCSRYRNELSGLGRFRSQLIRHSTLRINAERLVDGNRIVRRGQPWLCRRWCLDNAGSAEA